MCPSLATSPVGPNEWALTRLTVVSNVLLVVTMETIFATKVNDDRWHCGRHRGHLLSAVETGVSVSTARVPTEERQCLVTLGGRGPLAELARARASHSASANQHSRPFRNLAPKEHLLLKRVQMQALPTSLNGEGKLVNGEERQILHCQIPSNPAPRPSHAWRGGRGQVEGMEVGSGNWWWRRCEEGGSGEAWRSVGWEGGWKVRVVGEATGRGRSGKMDEVGASTQSL